MSTEILRTAKSLIETLASSIEKRERLVKATADLDEEIHKTRQAVFGLVGLIPETELEKLKAQNPEVFDEYADSRLGITDAVREVLKSRKDFMTPTEVRDAVLKISRSLDGHKNPVGSVHTVLKRLVDADEVMIGIDDKGITMYGWCADEESLKQLLPRFDKDDREEMLANYRKSQERKMKTVYPEKKGTKKRSFKLEPKPKKEVRGND